MNTGQKRAGRAQTILAGIGLCFNNNGDDKSLQRTDWMGGCGDIGVLVAAIAIDDCGGELGRGRKSSWCRCSL